MRNCAAALRGSSWRRYATIVLAATLAVIFYAWVDQAYSLPWNPDRPSPPTFPAAPLVGACDGVKSHTGGNKPIPNLVHYIWLLADPTVLRLDFKVFVSVYSAHLFFKPDRIYFHTDVAPDVWDRAKVSGDAWTKRVLAIPGVTPNYIENPTLTTTGNDIDTFGAKSDFIRADVLRKFGGIYLDVDAVPLRDVAPLRHSGFASVVGGAVALAPKHTGYVNTGVWLSQPHSTLSEIFYTAMDRFYNGMWAISVSILTDLAYRLHAVPGEVLIMNPRAFAPASWELDDQIRMFKPHRETPPPSASASGSVLDDAAGHPPELKNTCEDALAWLVRREESGRYESWEMDFSATYVLHAFDDYADKIWGWDGKITLKYILARQSNYARAVYPAMWHAIKAGMIPMDETV